MIKELQVEVKEKLLKDEGRITAIKMEKLFEKDEMKEQHGL